MKVYVLGLRKKEFNGDDGSPVKGVDVYLAGRDRHTLGSKPWEKPKFFTESRFKRDFGVTDMSDETLSVLIGVWHNVELNERGRVEDVYMLGEDEIPEVS